MTDVGISGGIVLQQLGTPAEVAAFFSLIEHHKSKSVDGRLEVVTDRLFRRTVRGEQFDALVEQLAECRHILERVRISDGFWDRFGLGDRAVSIDRSATNAAQAFRRLFDSLEFAIKMARMDKKEIGYLRPLRLMSTDGPKYYEHKFMPLEELEKPDIRPIWME